MLLAYRPSDGRVLWNSGTNSADPKSLHYPDAAAYTSAGSDVLLKRIDDSTDDAHRILRGDGAVVLSGAVIFDGGANPAPPPAPPELSMSDVLGMIQALQDQSAALQAQSDTLTLMVLGGSL